MDKADLVAQLLRHLRASADDAAAQMAAASVEAREGATPAEKREDARVALEQGSIARGQQQRLQRARADLALLEGFCPRPLSPSAEIELGAVVEVDSEQMGRTFFLAPAGAGVELTGPGGDGYLSVVTRRRRWARRCWAASSATSSRSPSAASAAPGRCRGSADPGPSAARLQGSGANADAVTASERRNPA